MQREFPTTLEFLSSVVMDTKYSSLHADNHLLTFIFFTLLVASSCSLLLDFKDVLWCKTTVSTRDPDIVHPGNHVQQITVVDRQTKSSLSAELQGPDLHPDRQCLLSRQPRVDLRPWSAPSPSLPVMISLSTHTSLLVRFPVCPPRNLLLLYYAFRIISPAVSTTMQRPEM
jgi:hypothetical protein